jgi:hypothetical protein
MISSKKIAFDNLFEKSIGELLFYENWHEITEFKH